MFNRNSALCGHVRVGRGTLSLDRPDAARRAVAPPRFAWRAPSTNDYCQALGFGQSTAPAPEGSAFGRPAPSGIVLGCPAGSPEIARKSPGGSVSAARSLQRRAAPAAESAGGLRRFLASRDPRLGPCPGPKALGATGVADENAWPKPRVSPPFQIVRVILPGYFGAGDNFQKSAFCAACLRCREFFIARRSSSFRKKKPPAEGRRFFLVWKL